MNITCRRATWLTSVSAGWFTEGNVKTLRSKKKQILPTSPQLSLRLEALPKHPQDMSVMPLAKFTVITAPKRAKRAMARAPDHATTRHCRKTLLMRVPPVRISATGKASAKAVTKTLGNIRKRLTV
jgi:hypothetical protein